MNLYVLGSCSGTEPKFHRNYTSWVLEEACGRLLLFDAGENCAPTAYLLGLDPLRLDAVFISHPHWDHTAGLPAVLHTRVKEEWIRNRHEKRDVHAYSPCPQLFTAAEAFIEMDRDHEKGLQIVHHELAPGPLFCDEEVSVECLPTRHRPCDAKTGKPTCYGFRITLNDRRRIIYTGDFCELDEFSPWLQEGAELMLLETGHHTAADLCTQLRQSGARVGELLFLHHGRAILQDPVGERAKAQTAWGKPVTFAQDSMLYAF